MAEKKAAPAPRLKIFVFSIGSGKYESGVVVVVAKTLKTAQKLAYKAFGNSTIFGISSPASFSSYTEKPLESGYVVSHSYAE